MCVNIFLTLSSLSSVHSERILTRRQRIWAFFILIFSGPVVLKSGDKTYWHHKKCMCVQLAYLHFPICGEILKQCSQRFQDKSDGLDSKTKQSLFGGTENATVFNVIFLLSILYGLPCHLRITVTRTGSTQCDSFLQ